MLVELRNKAKELGIKNAETLTESQLNKAIKAAEKALKISEELKAKAIALGVDVEGKSNAELSEAIATAEVFAKAKELGLETEDKTLEELSDSIAEAELLAKEINDQARQAELLSMLSEYLGITDIGSLTKEEVSTLLEKKKAEEALQSESGKGSEVKAEKVEEPKGKSTKAFNLKDKEYVFKNDAPAAFRYLGQLKTQEEWMEDGDALELMIAGNLSFLTLKK